MKQRLLWFYVLLGGAIAWLIHLMVTYAIGEFACVAKGELFIWGSLSSTHWFIYLASILCLAFSIGALIFSIRLNKSIQNSQFLRTFGVFVNLIFSLAIVAQTVPNIIFSGDC